MENKTIALFFVIIVLLAAVAGVMMLKGDGTEGDRTVTDSRGREITVPSDFDKILCHNCCSLELVSYFNSVDKVAAIDKDDAVAPNKTYTQVYKEKFSTLEKVDCSNLESIIVLNPDVVISSTVSVQDLDNMQEKLGIPVYAINADLEFGSDAWYDQITLLGKLLREESRAKEIVDGVKDIIKDIQKAKVTGKTGYACGMMFYGKGSFLKVSGDYLPFDYSGVENVMPSNPKGVGGQPYETDLETVASKTFDYVFIDGSNADSVLQYIRDNRAEIEAAHEMPAFANGDVYRTMVYKMWGTQWDNHLINCLYVAKTVNPDGYQWDFEDKANEVFDLFYGEGKFTYSQVVVKCDKLEL